METRINLQGMEEGTPPYSATIRFDGARAHGPEGVECAFARVLEAKFPLAAAGVRAGSGLRFQFSLWQGGLPLDAVPRQGWIELASTAAWRVSGLDTAGNNVKLDVWAAARPSVTNVSRHSSWLSRMPAPSKPAASTPWISWSSCDIGAVPGIRSDT